MKPVEPVPFSLVWIKFVCIFHVSFLFHSLCFGVLKFNQQPEKKKSRNKTKLMQIDHVKVKEEEKNMSKNHIIISFAKLLLTWACLIFVLWKVDCDLKMAKFSCFRDRIWVLSWRIIRWWLWHNSLFFSFNLLHSLPVITLKYMYFCFLSLPLPRFHRHLSLRGYYSHVQLYRVQKRTHPVYTGAHQNWMRLWWWAPCVVHNGITNKTNPTALYLYTLTYKHKYQMCTWNGNVNEWMSENGWGEICNC